MIQVERRGRVGWTVTLVTRRHLRTLWIGRPAVDKLTRAHGQ
jgi:hypothetical protein